MLQKIINCRLLVFLLSLLSLTARAGQPAAEDRQLQEFLSRLSDAEGCAYQASITSQITGNKKEQEAMHMYNYQSRKAFIVYSKSEDALVFICEHGQLRVNPKEKTAYYAQYPTDTAALHQLKNRMLSRFSADMVSSFLLSGATISSKTINKGLISYKLTYAPEATLTGCSIICDQQRATVVSISYTMQRPIEGSAGFGDNQASVMQQKVNMDHYEQKIPADVTNLLTDTKDIRAYLERNYQGYKIEKINL